MTDPLKPSILSLLFGLSVRVTRKQYITAGLSLFALKFAVDSLIVYTALHRVLDPRTYLFQSAAQREHSLGVAIPTNIHMALGLVALPFLWVGLSMSIRRAADAARSPWIGTLFLMPVVNFLVMFVLSILPSLSTEVRWSSDGGSPFRGAQFTGNTPPPSPGLRPSILGVLAATALGLGSTLLSVYVLGTYGIALFFVTPFAMGALCAVIGNPRGERDWTIPVGLSAISVVLTGCAILLFALEGLVCLFMAAPIAIVLAMMGAVIAHAISRMGRSTLPEVAACFFFGIPSSALLEAQTAAPVVREASSSVEIDAPPEVVWRNVISFPPLRSPPAWIFRLGVAYPQRARIEGEGVGAVRYCEFSTGPFVEPITRWEPGRRLSFDVRSQPPPMTELSPYGRISAPHLNGYMTSRRGEFRLIELPNHRTRLEGSTWYTLSIYPEGYWVVHSQLLLHGIHSRVLSHIKQLSEHEYRQTAP